MNAYRSLFLTRFKTMLQYRSAALAGFVCQFVFGLVMVMGYAAFFASSTRPQPMDLRQTIVYVWLGQAFLAMLPWTVDKDFQALVNTGAVAYELLRPLDLYNLWFTRCLAQKAAATLLRAVPLFICTAVIMPWAGAAGWALSWPASPHRAGMFALAMAGSLLLSTTITTAANITLIWTISGRGVALLITSVVTIFSGMIIPLPFFPDWCQGFLFLLPFRGVTDGPYRIFSGHIPAAGYPAVFIHQISWIIILMLCGRRLVRRASGKMVVQGG